MSVIRKLLNTCYFFRDVDKTHHMRLVYTVFFQLMACLLGDVFLPLKVYAWRYCGRPWPAAYINIIQTTHQIQVLTKLNLLMLDFIRRTTSGVPNIVGWPTARSKLFVKSVGLPITRGKLVYEFSFHKEGVNLPCLFNAISISFSKKLAKVKLPKVKTFLIGKECERTSHQ